MGIKWDDVKIGVSPLSNQIYLGKTKPIKGNPRLELWTDKSGDKTKEVILAVMQHMLHTLDTEGKSSYKSGKATLTISVEEED